MAKSGLRRLLAARRSGVWEVLSTMGWVAGRERASGARAGRMDSGTGYRGRKGLGAERGVGESFGSGRMFWRV